MRLSVFALAALAIVVASIFPVTARAEQQDTIFDRHCGYYHSSRDFVQKASLFCIGKTRTKNCAQQARQYCQPCNFRGDYNRISSEVHTGMLFMLVLAGAPEMAHLKHQS